MGGNIGAFTLGCDRENMKDKIIAVLGFDMETDIGSWTPYYKGLVEGTPKLLNLLSKENIKATFFFVGEAAKKYPNIVKEIAERGHEVGCHSLFHETVGDELFPIPGVKPLLPEEVPLRLKKATEWVSEVLGDKIFSFRAPRLWGSTIMIRTLETLGYKADLSYPLYYYGKQLVPYHPSSYDWTTKGDMKILEIPNFADVTIKSKDKYGRDRDQWPVFRTEGAKKLITHIKNYIDYVKSKGLPVVLCFYFHPWEFVKMPKGLIRTSPEGCVLPDKYIVKNCGNYALLQLEKVIKYLKSIGTTFMEARELADVWDTLSI
jgi:peptidoglycan/xylan/chitin deacetylase (PgdA/CDA1 family)